MILKISYLIILKLILQSLFQSFLWLILCLPWGGLWPALLWALRLLRPSVKRFKCAKAFFLLKSWDDGNLSNEPIKKTEHVSKVSWNMIWEDPDRSSTAVGNEWNKIQYKNAKPYEGEGLGRMSRFVRPAQPYPCMLLRTEMCVPKWSSQDHLCVTEDKGRCWHLHFIFWFFLSEDSKLILGVPFICFRNRRWPDILPHYFMVLVPFFIVLVTYLYIIWSPSSVAIKNVIPLTPVLLFLLVLSTHSRSSALVTVTSLCAMTSAWVKTSHRKTIKYQLILLCALLYLLLPWWGMWPHIQIPAHAVTTAAERSWKRLLSVGRFLLPLHTVNPGIAAAWKLPQTGYTRETGNHTLESYPLH